MCKRLCYLLVALGFSLGVHASSAMMRAVQTQIHFQYVAVANFAAGHYATGAIIPGNFSAANTSQTTSPKVASGVLIPQTASEVESGYWNQNNSAFSNASYNQFGYAVIGALNNVNDAVGVVLRGGNGGNNGYYCYVGGPTGASAFYAIAKIVAGSFSFLVSATTSPVSIAVGGVVACRITGTTIEIDYFPPTTGNGTGLATTTDASLSIGFPGVYVQANEATLTNAAVSEWIGGFTQ